MDPVVSVDWLIDHTKEVQVADVRWYLDGRSGRTAYEQGHIPGALFIDLDRWLAGPSQLSEGRHPLPDPAVFAAGMSQSGIDDEHPVVAYDDEGGVIAARLVWLLRTSGHPAALLNGGLSAYKAPLVQGWRAAAPQPFAVRPWPQSSLATLNEVVEVSSAPSSTSLLVDARDESRYRGEHEPIDSRAGHIPGAINIPCRSNLDENGLLLSRDQLRDHFERAGVTDASQVISYCGSGVTACHNLLTMEWCGLGRGRLFPGSWSQYSGTSKLPVAVGDDQRS